MLIQQKQLEHWIDNFYGYGSWKARIWFVAHEESGGDVPEDVAERIQYFSDNHSSNTAALCDMRELFQHVTARIEGPKANLFKTLFDYRFGKHAIKHGGWKNLIAFAHGFNNKKPSDLFDDQQKKFVSDNHREALLTLYPLPAPHNHAWYYSWLDLPKLGFIRNRNHYQTHLFPKRIATILEHIKQHKPELVLLYGMSNVQLLKTSVQDFFPTAKFSSSKAIKLQLPQHHWCKLDNTILVITTQVPTLRHNRIETGFDWYAFGKLMAQHQ